jgi:hypothetical protein
MEQITSLNWRKAMWDLQLGASGTLMAMWPSLSAKLAQEANWTSEPTWWQQACSATEWKCHSTESKL